MNTAKRYRVEWQHNGQWRMDDDGSGTFRTNAEAEKYAQECQRYSSGNLIVRIIEVA